MLNYKNHTITAVTNRGLYQVADAKGDVLVLMSLVRECKKFIDAKVKVGA